MLTGVQRVPAGLCEPLLKAVLPTKASPTVLTRAGRVGGVMYWEGRARSRLEGYCSFFFVILSAHDAKHGAASVSCVASVGV